MSLHMALPELVLALLALIANPFVGALLVAVAVIAIAAELKAGASGLGILVSFVAMGLFFAASLTMGLGGWLEVLLALLGSLALAVEVFLLPGFGVAGVLGIALMGTAVLLAMLGPTPNTADVAAALMAILTATAVSGAAIYAWVRRLPTSDRFRGLLLRDSIDSAAGYVSGTLRHDLHGQTGRALTALRPSGVAEIGGERMDVVTEGDWLPEGSRVTIVRSEGYRHIVRSAPAELPLQPPASSET